MRVGVWRHMATLDMDLLIVKVQYKGHNYSVCRVMYFNRKGQLLHPDKQTVRIKKEDYWKWSNIA